MHILLAIFLNTVFTVCEQIMKKKWQRRLWTNLTQQNTCFAKATHFAPCVLCYKLMNRYITRIALTNFEEIKIHFYHLSPDGDSNQGITTVSPILYLDWMSPIIWYNVFRRWLFGIYVIVLKPFFAKSSVISILRKLLLLYCSSE